MITCPSAVELQSVLPRLPREQARELKDGKATCLLASEEMGRICGTLVFSSVREPDNKRGKALLLEYVFCEPKYRRRGVCRSLVDYLLKYAAENRKTGIIVQTELPETEELEKALIALGFWRLRDGNSIYEVPLAELLKHPWMKRELPIKRIRAVSELSPQKRMDFLNSMGERFPKGLSPDRLPGKWLPQLSFVCESGNTITGYVLSSVFSEELLYVGALYHEEEQGFLTAALLKRLGMELMKRKDIKRVLFAAASEEGERLCRYLTKDASGVKKTEIHNLYREV